MRKLLQFLLILLSYSSLAQNIWEPVILPDTLQALCVNAEKEGVLFVSATSDNGVHGLYRSFDDGNTWQYLPVDPVYGLYISSIRYNLNGVLFVDSPFGIWRSYDDGDNFELISPDWNILNINFSPSNEVYAVGWYGIRRSLDNGNSWDTLFATSYNDYISDIDFGLNGEIYAVGGGFTFPNESGFWRSLDNGETWENIGITNQHLQSVQVNNDGVIIVGGFDSDGVYTSNDIGLTWTYLADIEADVMESYSDDLLIAGANINEYEGCWFSEDWGNTWINLADSVLNPRIRNISVSPSNTVYVQTDVDASYSHNVFRSINPILSTGSDYETPRMKIYPNPAGKTLSILLDHQLNTEYYRIYDQMGKIVKTGDFTINQINVSELSSGIYILELGSGKEILRERFIIGF
jgi:hypothetical protein